MFDPRARLWMLLACSLSVSLATAQESPKSSPDLDKFKWRRVGKLDHSEDGASASSGGASATGAGSGEVLLERVFEVPGSAKITERVMATYQSADGWKPIDTTIKPCEAAPAPLLGGGQNGGGQNGGTGNLGAGAPGSVGQGGASPAPADEEYAACNVTNPIAVYLGGKAPIARIDCGMASVHFALETLGGKPAKSGAPALEGSTATYKGAAPSADFSYTVVELGGEMRAIFSAKPEGSAGARFRLSHRPWVEIKTSEAGADSFGTVSGSEHRFDLGHPSAVDASGAAAPAPRATLTSDAFEVTLDAAWLASAKYPVTLTMPVSAWLGSSTVQTIVTTEAPAAEANPENAGGDK